MLEMEALYAGYGFASHKGYPTPEHCRALKELGALPIHRRSFGRVREVLGLERARLLARHRAKTWTRRPLTVDVSRRELVDEKQTASLLC